jgi:hypothetical protein
MRRKLLTLTLAAGGIGLAGWSVWAQDTPAPRPSTPAAREVQGQPPPPPRGERPGRSDPDQPPRPRDDDPRRGRGDDDGPRRPRDEDFRRPMNAPRPDGGTLMYATDKYVYVLRGDELMQFDANGLNLLKKVRLPAPERPDRDGDRRQPRD